MGSALRLGAAPRHPGTGSPGGGPQSRTGGSRGRDRLKLLRGRLAALDGLALTVTVVAFGVATGAFTGTVKGYDGWGHLTKVVLVLKDFPAIDWNYDWYSGSPFFLGGYPPLFYLAASAVAWLGVNGAIAMNLLIALSYLAMTVGINGLVRMATGSRPAAGAASGLLPATPAIWAPFVPQGLYTPLFVIAI